MAWELLVAIAGALLIVIVLLVMHVIAIRERVDVLESSEHALWGSVNCLGDNDDELRGRIWKLEHKDGKQNG